MIYYECWTHFCLRRLSMFTAAEMVDWRSRQPFGEYYVVRYHRSQPFNYAADDFRDCHIQTWRQLLVHFFPVFVQEIIDLITYNSSLRFIYTKMWLLSITIRILTMSDNGEKFLIRLQRRVVWQKFTNDQGDNRPGDGGNRDLWNLGRLLPDYTALQRRRRLPSSGLTAVKTSNHTHISITLLEIG